MLFRKSGGCFTRRFSSSGGARTVACLSLAAASLLCGPADEAAAQAPKPCIPPFGWWESVNQQQPLKGLMPIFSNPKPAGANDCSFQIWSWTAFAHWVQTDPNTKLPYFVGLPTPGQLGGPTARSPGQPPKLVLRVRDQKPQSIGGFEQAGSQGVLVDQNGRAAYYATHMDPTFFAFAQKYYGAANYKKASPTLTFPVNATVFKTSWRIVPQGQTPTDAFTMTADIELLAADPKNKGRLIGTGKLQPNVTVALVGMHVVGVVQDHPEFIWASFEQLNNAPDLPFGMQPTSTDPVSADNFTFYKGGTPANLSNIDAGNLTIDEATQVISPVTNAFRQFAFGAANPDNVMTIQTSTQNFHETVQTGVPTILPAFANYRLLGSAWQQANTLIPGNGNMDVTTIGSVALANATLETFVQGMPPKGTNCFSCHNTSAHGKDIPGKDINLIHMILKGVKPQSPRAVPSP